MGFIELAGASGAVYRFRLWPTDGAHSAMAGLYLLTSLSPRKPLQIGLSEDLSGLAAGLAPQFGGPQIYTRLMTRASSARPNMPTSLRRIPSSCTRRRALA